MPNIYGPRGTTSLGDLRKYDISDKLWLVDGDYATLAFFARKLAKKPTTDAEFRWFEKTSPSRQDSINNSGGYSSSATTITVADGSKFKAGMVIQDVATGEQMRVTAVSGNNLTVVRGWGTTPAAAISNNDVIVILGNANAEGASVPQSLTSQAVKKVNYTQIFREPFEVTGTENATEIYAGGNDLAKLREEHLQLHLKDIERAFFFGEPKEDTSGSQPVRATGGLRYWITTNVETQTDLTNAEFEAWIRKVFSKGGDKKLGFLSPLIASAVNSWAAGKLNMFPKDKTYGIAVTNYLSIHGELNFVVEKLFAENSTYNGYAFAVDMDHVAYRYLNGNGNNRDTKLLKNRQNPGDDKIIEEYFSEVGLQLALEDRHGFLKGVQTYS
jgi:hypothetical protein